MKYFVKSTFLGGQEWAAGITIKYYVAVVVAVAVAAVLRPPWPCLTQALEAAQLLLIPENTDVSDGGGGRRENR